MVTVLPLELVSRRAVGPACHVEGQDLQLGGQIDLADVHVARDVQDGCR